GIPFLRRHHVSDIIQYPRREAGISEVLCNPKSFIQIACRFRVLPGRDIEITQAAEDGRKPGWIAQLRREPLSRFQLLQRFPVLAHCLIRLGESEEGLAALEHLARASVLLSGLGPAHRSLLESALLKSLPSLLHGPLRRQGVGGHGKGDQTKQQEK